MHENSNWQNLYEQTEVTLLETYPHIPIPSRTFAGRLGSALKLLDRSTAAWASLKRSTCEISRLSPDRGVATLRRVPASCLTEVGEAECLDRKQREKRYWVENH